MKMKEKTEIIQPAELNRTLRGSSPHERLLHRLHGVVLVLYGLSASEAGRIYGDSARSVAYWVQRFREDGIQGLEDGARSGRPSKLNATQLQELQAFVSRCRQEKQAVSGAGLAAHILQEFGVKITRRQGVRMLRRFKGAAPGASRGTIFESKQRGPVLRL
jgi:transposase